jgi:hypothetical protein
MGKRIIHRAGLFLLTFLALEKVKEDIILFGTEMGEVR